MLGERGFAKLLLEKSGNLRRELGNPERTARTEQAIAALRGAAPLGG